MKSKLKIAILILLLFVAILFFQKKSFWKNQVVLLQPTLPQNYQALLPDMSDNPLGSGEEVSFVTAQKRLSFSIPQPNAEVVTHVWVSTNPKNPSEQSIAVRFKSDLLIIIHKHEKPIDNWDRTIAIMPMFKKIDVNGNSGMGVDPGVTEVRGQPYAYPGSIEWWVNGLDITLYSDTMSLEELLEIANTIYLADAYFTPTEAQTYTETPSPTETQIPTETPSPTETPTSTDTPSPEPSETPTPTETPTP